MRGIAGNCAYPFLFCVGGHKSPVILFQQQETRDSQEHPYRSSCRRTRRNTEESAEHLWMHFFGAEHVAGDARD